MKKATFALALVGLLALGGGQAYAELCAIDAVPAATLLLPYFEVDLDNPNGVNTLFEINNASDAATIAHVIFWTNWSAPTIDFDVFLTGYDVQSVNLRDVFQNFNLPRTADAGRDPADTISPHGGEFSNNPAWDGVFGSCAGILPFNNPVITGNARDRLVNGHTGNVVASLGNGRCLGADLGDNVARGYVTVDNASACSLVLDPGDPAAGYFLPGGTGIANNINQLWGNYYYVDVAGAFAQGDTLVHIEADDELTSLVIPLLDPNTGVTVATVANSTGYTFYGRYTAPLGSDNREPLGTTWAARYLLGASFDGTEYVVWRDSTADNVLPSGGICGNSFGAGPDWFPLNETEVVAFNEAEDAVELCFFQGGVISPPDESDEACFPYETGRYPVGPGIHPYEGSPNPLDPPFNFGWMFLNLNLPPDNPTGDVDFGSDGNIAQSYVTVLHQADGLYSVGLSAIELTDACEDINPSIADFNDVPAVQGGN